MEDILGAQGYTKYNFYYCAQCTKWVCKHVCLAIAVGFQYSVALLHGKFYATYLAAGYLTEELKMM